jgi:hypothetical protein
MPGWQQTIEAFPEPMHEISDITKSATEKLHRGDREGKGFAYRVGVAREMAAEMDDSATQMKDLGEKYAAQLLEIDHGVRALMALHNAGCSRGGASAMLWAWSTCPGCRDRRWTG